MTYKLLFDANIKSNLISVCENTAVLNMTLRCFLIFHFAVLVTYTHILIWWNTLLLLILVMVFKTWLLKFTQ